MTRSSPEGSSSELWLSRFTRLTATCTLFLIFAGGKVTSHDAGLAVPDWPLSFGMLFPPMVGNIFYEHGHRMVAAFVGFLTLVQTAWICRQESRAWVRKLSVLSLGAVVLQGALGGLTVHFLLPQAVSTFHACLAQAFFCLTIWIAFATHSRWKDLRAEVRVSPKDWKAPLWVALAIYFQLGLGAWMRHAKAGLAIQDFPTMQGGWIPHQWSETVFFHFAHRVWGFAVFLFVLGFFLRTRSPGRYPQSVRTLSSFSLGIVSLQILLGAYVIWWQKEPNVTSFHVVNGALLLGWMVVTTLESYRSRQGRVD